MFIVAIVSTFVVAHVAAEIPSYIHVCGRRDPNIEQCILDNVLRLKNKICEGIPELDIVPNEPFIIERVVFLNIENAKISLENLSIIGLCDYKIHSFRMDLEKNSFDVDLTFRRIEINTTYDIDLRIIVPIITRGPGFFATENVSAKVQFNLQTIMKNGTKYAYIPRMKVELGVKGYETSYMMSNETLSVFQEAVEHFIGSNQREIIDTVKPYIERVVSERCLIAANQIIKHFTYDELFPDRT